MKQQKVCHITSAHSRYDVRIFQKECRSLAEAGFDVTLIVNDQLPDEDLHGVKIQSTGIQAKTRLQRLFLGAKKAYELARSLDADIYHLHDTELLRFLIPLRKQAEVVYDSHEFTAKQILSREYLPSFARQAMSKLYQLLERRVLPQASAIVVPTSIDGDIYFDRFGPPVVLVNNYSLLREMDLEFLPIDERKSYACYLGSLTHARGLTPMIEAANLSGVPLVLAGAYSPDSVKEELESMQQEGVGVYLGVLDRGQVRDTMKHARMGLNLLQDQGQYAHLDNLPTKVYEYMNLGLPVILSEFPYAKKILGEYPFGISVDPTNPKEIAQAMRYIMEHPVEANEMGQAGIRAIHEKFNWEKEAEKLIELYIHLGKGR